MSRHRSERAVAPLGLIELHATVLGAPAMKRLFNDAKLLGRHRDATPASQHLADHLGTVSLPDSETFLICPLTALPRVLSSKHLNS